jgi:RNA polymerase sigma factor (sigma-70 family)
VEQLPSLVKRAQAGDLEAFNVLVARFQDMAYAQAYAMLGDAHLAEDVAQEAFIDAYVSLPRLREAVAFPAWFRKIVFKHADRLVRGTQTLLVPLEFTPDLPASTPDPALVAEAHETNGCIHKAIAALPAHERSAIMLHYLGGVAYKDLAAFLDVPVSTVKKRLHDARKRLKQRMIDIADTVQIQPPSHDDRFANRVRFLLAIRTGDLECVKTVLDHDPALVDVREEWNELEEQYYDSASPGWTPLHRAAWQGHAELVELLLTHGAGTGATKQGGMTPLHLASQMGYQQVVEVLLAHGAEPNARMGHGLTPLHWAVIRGRHAITEILLAHGAIVDAVGKGGRTPLDWAELKGYRGIAALLRAHGAQR